MFLFLPHIWTVITTNYLRLLAEHFGIESSADHQILGGETRTIRINWLLKVILWPHNLNYHQEHHWFPSIPYYSLPKLHNALSDNPDSREMMYVTIGMRNLINEITS